MLGARCRGDKAEAADGPAGWASLRDALKCSMQGLETSLGSSRELMEGSGSRWPVPFGFQYCNSGGSGENELE